MRKKILQQFSLSENEIPSYYKLMKDRPKINSFVVPVIQCHSQQVHVQLNIDTTYIEETSLVPLISPTNSCDVSSFIGETSISVEDAYSQVVATKKHRY